MHIENNILFDEIQKGIPWTLAVESTELDFGFDQIEAEFKYENRINAPATVTLTKGQGVTVETDGFSLALTGTQTQALKARDMFMDAKGKNVGQEPVLLLTAKIIVRETVTDI